MTSKPAAIGRRGLLAGVACGAAASVRDRRWLLVAGAGALVLAGGWAGGAAGRVALLVGILLPFVAAAAATTVAREPQSGRAWWGFAAAAAAGGLAHTIGGFGGGAVLEAWLRGAALLALALAVFALLDTRTRTHALERWVDAALLGGASLAAALRWAAPFGGDSGASLAAAAAAVFVPAAALCLIVPCTLLLATWTRTPARGVAFFVTAAALLQAAPALYAPALGGGGADHGVALAATTAGWLCLLYACAWVVRGAVAAAGLAAAAAGAHLLREIAAPAAALLLGAVLIDAAVRHSLATPTALSLGALGALLALRVSLLLRTTRRLSAERRELAQSRALVEVSQALAAGSTELDETLQLVTDWASRLFGARGAAIELLSDDESVLILHSVHGLSTSLIGLRSPVASTFTGWVVRHGRARSTLDPRRERDMAPAGLPVLGDSPVAAAPLHFRGRRLGVLACIGNRPFDAEDIELLGALAEQAAIAIENARLFREVRTLSMTDPLTGLPNRRQLERDLRREFSAAQRGRRLVAVMFDLDEFKVYNDSYGHPAGDDALCVFAGVLASLTRRENLAVRLGGDEFLALLTDTDAHGAEVFVARVRERFTARMSDRGRLDLSVGAGIAEYEPGMLVSDELIAAADRALYDNKLVRVRT